MAKRKIKVDRTPLAEKRCPYCGNELEHPLGVGPTSKALMAFARREYGWKLAPGTLKRLTMLGLLPRPIKRRMMIEGQARATSVGVYPEEAKRRLKLINKLKDKRYREDEIIDFFEEKGLRYV